MVFSYSGDPTTSDLDQVRFWIQDTDRTEILLPDEELQFLINLWNPLYKSLLYVASVACEIIAGRFAREITQSADGVTLSGDQLQQKYNDLAMSLRDQYKSLALINSGGPDVGGILYSEVYDSSIRPLVFALDMHDNPRAGQQDFGGTFFHTPTNEAGAVGESRP